MNLISAIKKNPFKYLEVGSKRINSLWDFITSERAFLVPWIFLPINKFILTSSIAILPYRIGRFCIITSEDVMILYHYIWKPGMAFNPGYALEYLDDLSDNMARVCTQSFWCIRFGMQPGWKKHPCRRKSKNSELETSHVCATFWVIT